MTPRTRTASASAAMPADRDAELTALRAELDLALAALDPTLLDRAGSPRGILDGEHVRRGLLEAGAARELCERLRSHAMADLGEWIVAAERERVPIAEIARLARLARATVYAVLDER